MGGRAGSSRILEGRASYFPGEPADEIIVGLYHQILLCPFRFRAEDIGAPWKDAPLFEAEGVDGKDAAYSQLLHAERAYFHPFVREFLYGPKGSSTSDGPVTPAIRRFKRDDVRWALVKYWAWAKPDKKWDTLRVALRVRRVELYLFDTGTGIFVVELDNRLGPHAHEHLLNFDKGTGAASDLARGNSALWGAADKLFVNEPLNVRRRLLTLADVLWLQDEVRRLYAPYWEKAPRADGKEEPIPGHCVDSIHWLDVEQRELQADGVSFQKPAETAGRAHTDDKGEIRLFPWWRRLLHPLIVREEPADNGENECTADLLGDERMGVMTYLAIVGDENDPPYFGPRQIGDADWMRLATQETPGPNDVFPYAPGLFAEADDPGAAARAFHERYSYDRHYDPRGTPPANRDRHTTRYLISGMAFVAVTRFHIEPRGQKRGFEIDPVAGLLAHFRYHYFKIGLIVHFQRATLLSLKDDLARAVDAFRGRKSETAAAEKRYADEVERLSLEISKFRSSYWFTELTGQLQGQEIFAHWGQHLRTPELCEEVASEVNDAREFLQSRHEQQLARSTSRAAWLAVFFAPLVLLSPFLAEWLTPIDPIMVFPPLLWLSLALVLLAGFSPADLKLIYLGESRSRRATIVLCLIAAIVWPAYCGTHRGSGASRDQDTPITSPSATAEPPGAIPTQLALSQATPPATETPTAVASITPSASTTSAPTATAKPRRRK